MVKYSASTKMGIKLLENIFKLPCYAGPPPSPLLQHILLLCEYSEPLGESIPASTNMDIELLENNFKVPCL